MDSAQSPSPSRPRLVLTLDSPADLERIVAQVRADGLIAEWRFADTPADFLAELAASPDVVLASHTSRLLPAHWVLQLVRERARETPVIVIADPSVDEEELASGLSTGAVDYLKTDRLARLNSAIARAIEVRNAHQARTLLQQEYQQAIRGRDSDRNYLDRTVAALNQKLEELGASREFLRHLLSASPVMIFSIEPEPPYAVRFISENVATAFGYAVAEFSDPSFWPSRVHPDDLPNVAAHLSRNTQTDLFTCEYRFAHADGRYRWIRSEAMLHRDADGRPLELVGYSIDVTDRRRAEEALIERERYFRSLIENVSDVIAVIDADGVITYASPSIERSTGFHPDELIDQRADRYVHPDDVNRLITGFRTGFAAHDIPIGEFRHLHRNGSWVQMEATGRALYEGGRIVGAVVTARDISARVQALDAMKREQGFRQAIEESMRAGVIVIDSSSRITYANASFCEMVGFSAQDLIGAQAPFPFWAPELANARTAVLQHVLAERRVPDDTETTYVRRDGTRLDVLIAASLFESDSGVQCVGVAYDISERKRLADQLRQSQKMEAIGRLAGGVAHDFNNLLTAILGYSGLLLDQIPPTHPFRNDIEQIRHAGESAATLTGQLLAFSRRQILKPEVLDLNTVITDLTKLLRRTIGEDIKLETRLAPSVGAIRADRGQIEQVLMNLAVNARDAMPKGGSLVIDTAVADLSAPTRHGRWTIPAGRYARVTVIDTGSGMTAEVLNHIFEPFFTTKRRGKGTGLGLPTVYGIVSQSGGHVAVESEAGAGSIFFVYLPLTDAAPTGRVATPIIEAARGSETILVAEDDPGIRAFAHEVLSAHGYQVLIAADGEQAETIADSEHRRIDLLFTDVVMPGISGTTLARRLNPKRPTMKVLYMTGYTDESLANHGVNSDQVVVLQKPFTAVALLRAVREVLSGTTVDTIH